VRFENLGNIHLRPQATIDLTNWFGQKQTLVVNPQNRNVLPGSIKKFTVVWGQTAKSHWWQNFWFGLKEEINFLAFGKHQVTLNLTYGQNQVQTLSQNLDFWLIPLKSILSLLILILILLIFWQINAKIKKMKKTLKTSLSAKSKT
jgi:hypothetical protein